MPEMQPVWMYRGEINRNVLVLRKDNVSLLLFGPWIVSYGEERKRILDMF